MPADPTTIAGPTEGSPRIALARLGVVTGDNDEVSDWIDVHFNPASLQLQLSNELKEGKNQQRKQYIAKVSAKMTMDLQFDTTDSGEDVTRTTRRLQAFVAPQPPPGQSPPREQAPPVVLFEWGALKFKGVAENYKETIDYFSADGVPLRSSINLTLSRQDKVFDDASSGGGSGANAAVDAPASSAAEAAGRMNEPGAARAIAAANGEENLRFGAGASLTIGGGVTLKPPSGFASAGAGAGVGLGLGAGGGVGVGASAGVGGGISVGIGASAGVGVGASAGLSSTARLSATEGAFAGLRPKTTRSSAPLDAGRLMASGSSGKLAAGVGARFELSGKINGKGPEGLRTNVSAPAVGSAKLQFDRD